MEMDNKRGFSYTPVGDGVMVQFPATEEAEAGRKMTVLRVVWISEWVQGKPEQLSETLSQTT